MSITESSRPSIGVAVVLESNNTAVAGAITSVLRPASTISARIIRGCKFEDFLGLTNGFWRENSQVPDEVRRFISGSEHEQDTDSSSAAYDENNPTFWEDRWIKAKKDEFSVEEELDYTRKLLAEDREHCYAWLQRQKAIESTGRWDEELQLCNELIIADPTSKAVWEQRFYVVVKFVSSSPFAEEFEQAIKYILDYPTVENPWLYLRRISSLVDITRFSKELDRLFCELFPVETFIHGFDMLADEVEGILAAGEDKYGFALITLLELAYQGYEPCLEVVDGVNSLSLTNNPLHYFDTICDALTLLYPLKRYYWKWLALGVANRMTDRYREVDPMDNGF
ncbi:proteinfarnesyltransferase/ geranylgeranyltransferase type-1 subunit alpha [Striga asiatica]|uniref:Proteinfarnesyltransferase/ geranylgeranyltransferase type-1 subunit alpha n=1 Tax=Striga asiatica TaxID=4170 RepID=A0A5A7Q4P4_STRAF|nr:proteinfarnesyltransferase/ geranylgeranyltransferase type-1 subunit alpha [Striga asiatica]